MPNVNKYVKFIKGSLSAFNKLSNKDNSTLYFITDNETGNLSLYLGNTLISSGNIDPEELSLKDLLDVTLSETLELGNILTFNGTNWENTSLEVLKSWLDIPEMPGEMEGATESSDGLGGLVPAPASADRGNFLSGDGKWTNIVPIISNKIKTELETITKDAPAAFDTLKEIADWISDDQAGATKLVTRVGNLEGLVETQGEDIVEFKSVVGDLSNLNTSYIEGDTTNLVNEINGINERLTWQELKDEN